MSKKFSSLKFSLKTVLLCSITLNLFTIVIWHMCKTSKDIHVLLNGMHKLDDFKYLFSKSKCNQNSTDPYFITLVHSAPTHFAKRSAIRDTWAHSDHRTITYFLMGKIESSTLQKTIDEEDAQFHDIIQGNFIDSYHNLTYKHTMALKWFTENCPQIKYLLKMDDDVYANFPAIHEYLANNKQDSKFILGPYRKPEKVLRDGKWKVPYEQYISEYLPEYVEGFAIIYSNDFVVEAFKRTFVTPFLWLDDIFITGLIRTQLNVRIEPIYPFLLDGNALSDILYGKATQLSYSTFLLTKQNLKPEDIRVIWKYAQSYRTLNELQNNYI